MGEMILRLGDGELACDGITRRDVLRVGALGVAGLTLPELLRAEAAADGGRKETNCILLWLNGGPSHIDMFDPKPDAPAEVRGEFGVVETNVKGVRISDQLPLLAKQADKYSILRVTSPDSGHETATSYVLSGYKFTPALQYPAYGSVVAREKGFRSGMPPYAHLFGLPFGYGTAGYMGPVYNPFQIVGDPNSPSFSVRDVTPPAGVDFARIERRRSVLAAIDDSQRRAESAARAIRTMDEFYTRAYDLVTSPVAKKAFNLKEEPDALREDYGKNSFGQGCLLARRLVEAGVRFVTLNSGGWDTHTDNFKSLKGSRLPQLDRAYAALLKDLHARGLLESTLVICMGEFGRTPKVNSAAGRDHWGQAMFVTLGGGGVKRGIVVGETDAEASAPKERPITVEDVAATIYRAIGIDGNKTFLTADQRPVKIADGGTAVEELF
jgi:Protein of unknown function (DUF1501)